MTARINWVKSPVPFDERYIRQSNDQEDEDICIQRYRLRPNQATSRSLSSTILLSFPDTTTILKTRCGLDRAASTF